MAERRMFAKTIIDSDAFLNMPLTTQALYFHLSMRADDEGFVNNPQKIQRMIGASDDDLRLLCAKNFIIPFDSGIVVIKHWKIHNYIQNDRYKPTVYEEEKALLSVKPNKAYTLDTDCIQNGYITDTQVRIGKDRLGKDSINNTPPLSPSRGKETLLDMFNRLSEDRQISESLKDKLKEWMQYKKERKEGYKEMGLKSFLTQMEKAEQKYGTTALIDCIDASMSRGYKGVITELIGKERYGQRSDESVVSDLYKGISFDLSKGLG